MFDWLSDAYHDTKDYITGKTPGAPGTAGPAGVSDYLAQDPTTGLWFDQKNGQFYQDPDGQVPVAGPNVQQQVGAATAQEQALMAQLAASRQQQQLGFQGEQGLAASLNGTISGRGPSVAGAQLAQGLGQIGAEQQSQAAGVSGAAAPLAQLAAMHNTGAAQIGANQAAGLARAQEVAGAQHTLGGVLTAMAQQGQAGYNANLAGAQDFAHTAMSGASGREQTEEDRQKHDADALTNALKSGGSAATAAATMGK